MSVTIHGPHTLDPTTFVGNWRMHEAFAWSIRHRPDDADAYGLLVLRHRDSGLIDQSNAAVIRQALEPFDDGEGTGGAIVLNCNHFAYGWMEEVAVRVYRRGTTTTTAAFDTLARLVGRLAGYPILDELDYSRRVHAAALEGIRIAVIGVDRDALPDDWEGQVYAWLSENDDRQLENRDGNGARPDEEAVVEALTALCLIAPIDD